MTWFKLVQKSFGMMIIMLATASPAFAWGGSCGAAPEIDPGSMASALALLTGGLLMITDRLGRK